MTPTKHPLCNDILRAPIGDENCDDLHIRREDGAVWSFWKPTPEELSALVMGGTVALRVASSTHPPLSIHATNPEGDREAPLTPEESAALHDAVRDRHKALIGLTKRIVAEWVRGLPETPERRRLVDEFLDLMTMNHAPGEIIRDVPVDQPAVEPAVTQSDVDRYRADAEGWKGEAERFELRLREVSTALGEEWNVMPPHQAITAIKNRLAMAEAARDEWKADAERYRGEVMILEAVVDRVKEAVNPHPAES